MIGNAFAAAQHAKAMKERMEEEKNLRKIETIKKPRKQGWFKPDQDESTKNSEHSSPGRGRRPSAASSQASPMKQVERLLERNLSTSNSQSSLLRSSTGMDGSNNLEQISGTFMGDSSGGRRLSSASSSNSKAELERKASTHSQSSSRRSPMDKGNLEQMSSMNIGEAMTPSSRGRRLSASPSKNKVELERKFSTHSHSSSRRSPMDKSSSKNLEQNSSMKGEMTPSSRGRRPSSSSNSRVDQERELSMAYSQPSSRRSSFGKSSDSSPCTASSDACVVKSVVESTASSSRDDERLNDVTLLGRDGVKVRAVKYVLACQSPELQELLYAGSDATETVEVHLGQFGEATLLALKEYCVSDESGAKPFTVKDGLDSQSMFELVAIGAKYHINDLTKAATVNIMNVLHVAPNLVLPALEIARNMKGVKDMEETLYNFINESGPQLLVESNSLDSIGRKSLLTLLDKIKLNDAEKFRLLEKWIRINGTTPDNLGFAQQVSLEKLSLKTLLDDLDMITRVRFSGFFDPAEVDKIISGARRRRRSSHTKHEVGGLCYQFMPDGDVIVCSIDSTESFEAIGAQFEEMARLEMLRLEMEWQQAETGLP